MTLEQLVASGLEKMGITMPGTAQARFLAHLRLIEKWNRVHNLTAIRETDQMVALHLLDSLSLLPHVAGAHSLVDVGSGPGLPGVPLAIARPDLSVWLLDSSHKKCTFLEQARAELGLSNVTVVCARVEQWQPPEPFDLVVSRAFADLSDFVNQAKHLARPGGTFLAMKGVYPFEEIGRVPASHRVSKVVELAVPTLDAKRHLVFVEAA